MNPIKRKKTIIKTKVVQTRRHMILVGLSALIVKKWATILISV